MAVPQRITPSMYYKYLACPHWLYFDVYGDQKKKAPPTKFGEMLLRGGVLHEERMMADMACVTVEGATREERAETTLRLMREGTRCIYHGVLVNDTFAGDPDLLERDDSRGSAFGAYHYVATEIKSAERVTDAHKCQLSIYADLLESVQGVRPTEGYVLNGEGIRLSFSLDDFRPTFDALTADISRTLAGEPPAPRVSSACKQSPWFKECVRFAEERDDIALLYNVKKKVVDELRLYGINTVRDVLHMNAKALASENPLFKPSLLERMTLQARALTEKRHFLRGEIELPEAPLQIFFDIEGDPLRQCEYLFGHLVRRGPLEETYVCQVAERPEDEGKLWREFLEWADTIAGDFVVYHYGTYELSRLNALAVRHGVPAELRRGFETFRDRLVDLNEVVKDAIVFPLYFYGIKDIGKYIGYKRHGDITGGGESVAFYEEWLEHGERKTLDAIIEYNRDDVVATAYLKDWLAGQRDADEEAGE